MKMESCDVCCLLKYTSSTEDLLYNDSSFRNTVDHCYSKCEVDVMLEDEKTCFTKCVGSNSCVPEDTASIVNDCMWSSRTDGMETDYMEWSACVLSADVNNNLESEQDESSLSRHSNSNGCCNLLQLLLGQPVDDDILFVDACNCARTVFKRILAPRNMRHIKGKATLMKKDIKATNLSNNPPNILRQGKRQWILNKKIGNLTKTNDILYSCGSEKLVNDSGFIDERTTVVHTIPDPDLYQSRNKALKLCERERRQEQRGLLELLADEMPNVKISKKNVSVDILKKAVLHISKLHEDYNSLSEYQSHLKEVNAELKDRYTCLLQDDTVTKVLENGAYKIK